MSKVEPARSEAPGASSEPTGIDRRRALTRIGVTVVGAALVAPVALSIRSCVPNALYENPQRFKAGRLDGFAEGATFLPEQRVFVFRQGKSFHCLSAICTHLGCTVQLLSRGGQAFEFHCPCHGSKYRADGTNFSGPAPKPLAHHPLELAPDDGQLIIDLGETAAKSWRLKG